MTAITFPHQVAAACLWNNWRVVKHTMDKDKPLAAVYGCFDMIGLMASTANVHADLRPVAAAMLKRVVRWEMDRKAVREFGGGVV
jgi:hypothetical protein